MAEAPPPYSATLEGATHPPGSSQYTSPPGTIHNREASPLYLATPSPGSSQYPSPPGIIHNEEAPPPYLETRPPANNIPRQPSPHIPVSQASFPRFFGIYHALGTHSNMQIALSADAPPLFYISTHSSLSSHPSIILHSGVYPSSSIMATADFHAFSGSVDIKLFNQPLRLETDGLLNAVATFVYRVPQTSGPIQGQTQTQLERFEWKSSSGPEVQSLQESSYGMKCVNIRTGEVVAAWARPKIGHYNKAKIRFLLREDSLQGKTHKFETMVVISILAIMEKVRRRNNSKGSARASIVGGGFGGGAGGASSGF